MRAHTEGLDIDASPAQEIPLDFQKIKLRIIPVTLSVKMPANMPAMPVPKGSGYFCNSPK